jgi:glycosyltransferase involved in cell wall biosynthesis
VASFAEWLLAHEQELDRSFDAFDLWRPPDGGVGGSFDARAVRTQLRLFPSFLRWTRTAPRTVHYCMSATSTGLARDLLFVSALRMARRRVIGHLQVVPEDAPARTRALRALDRLVDRWVTVAPTSVRLLRGIGIDSEWVSNPIRVHPNGTRLPGASSGALRLLFVGRYGERKGCPELVAALARAREEGTDATLRFVGREERAGEEVSLRESVRSRNLEGAVEFAGVKDAEALAGCYEAADVLCLPSRREGMPLALLEGMAFGLPVIATPVGGIPDFVGADDNGLLVPAGDVPALAEAIGALGSDPARRARLGARGRERAHEQAGSDAITARWREIYDAVEAG